MMRTKRIMSDPIENLVMKTGNYQSQDQLYNRFDKAAFQKRAFLDTFYSQRFHDKK
jgi:hypothetical protein